MSCNRTVIVDPSAISRQSVDDQLGSGRQPIGDRSATGWRPHLERLFLIAETLQLIGDRSATDQSISRRLKTVLGLSATAATGRRWVANQSTTCRQPVCDQIDRKKVFGGFTCSNQNLLATKLSLQPSATGRRPLCNHPATSLRPPEILVARRSPTGCKLCVTRA